MKHPTPTRIFLRRCVAAAMLAAAVLQPRRSPATIEEQRARLPPPAQCTDPVEGIWRAHRFLRGDDWRVFTLEVHRSQPGSMELKGHIQNHGWSGTTMESEPPVHCRPGQEDVTVEMDAVGTVVGNALSFRAINYHWGAVHCLGWGGYNLDAFSGPVDFARQEFQAVNNDGGQDHNEPFLFRRISCFPTPQAMSTPGVTVALPPIGNPAPPPIAPEEKSRGCGFSF